MLNISFRNFNIVEHCLSWWISGQGQRKNLPFYILWELWSTRNHQSFDGIPVNISCICSKILAWADAQVGKTHMDQRIRTWVPHIQTLYITCMFDGVTQAGNSGCGAWIMISLYSYYKCFLHGYNGTNTRAEILALLGVLWFTRTKLIQHIHIYGDS